MAATAQRRRELFLAKKVTVDDETGCHVWGGSVLPVTGYGQYRTREKNMLAHRMVYELRVGPIPDDLQIHHRCENRVCVNVEHMELLTIQQHWRIGNSPSAVRARATHCQYGHEFTPNNTYVNPSTGYRTCKICSRAATNARRAAMRARAAA